MAISYMTEEGYKKMLEEIAYMENVKRFLQAFSYNLLRSVANARLIDETKLNTHTVQILNKVKIKNTKNNAVMQYMLVSESEANLKEGKIAVSTPIGKGLIGKKVGDIVEIQVPSGLMTFEIIDISI